ncbi:hypothetical protein ACSFBM_00545 [Variovorax sp. GB1R11]|uniref:hypothetical protein n=1 Tax=Variovorax sp. GB1R11 TaxID=3443741 RepID=UPI003F44A4C2
MKQTIKSASIEFLIDESADSLLARENSLEGSDGRSSEEILNLPLSNIRAREPAEIERTLGRLVLTFLNSRSPKGLNLPKDPEYEKEVEKEYRAELKTLAEKKTPAALYELAVSLIGRGIGSKNWADIDQGEIYLNESVEAGFEAAIKYRDEVWALVRPRLDRKRASD